MASFSIFSKNSWLHLSARPQRPSALYGLASLGVCPLLVLLPLLKTQPCPLLPRWPSLVRRDLHRSQGPACLLWTPGLPAQGRTPSSAARRPGTLVKAVSTYAPTGTLLRRPAGWLWAAVRPSLQGPGRGLPLARGVGQKPVPICTFGLTSWAVFSSPGLGDAAAGPLGTLSPCLDLSPSVLGSHKATRNCWTSEGRLEDLRKDLGLPARVRSSQ